MNTKRFKEGFAVGAATLALNACHNTVDLLKKEAEMIEARQKMNTCLRSAHHTQVAGLNERVDYKDLGPGLYGRWPKRGVRRRTVQHESIKISSDRGFVTILLPECEIKVWDFALNSFCSDRNGDGSWENTSGTLECHAIDYAFDIEENKPGALSEWNACQAACNRAYNRILSE